MAALEVRNLTRKYRQGQANEVQALDGVSFSVQPGEFISVVGRAGSGKTTLLHCVGLLLRPTSGQVIIGGIDTTSLSDAHRADFRGRTIGLVLQDFNLFPTLTALQNVMLPMRYAALGRGARKRARELLDMVGLADHPGYRPDQLSAGQAQRVAIARALIRAPSLVLADEPTGGVGDETSDQLLYLMQQLNRTTGVTFVIATHDPEVAACTDRMVRIRDGQVASDQRRRVDLRRLKELR